MKRLLIALIFGLAGCAQLTAVRVTDENPNPTGLPLYGTKPILVVTGQSATIEFIPNLNEKYALQLRTFLAKNDTTLTFNPNGTLQKSETALDSTSAIPIVEKALDKLVPVAPTTSGALDGQSATKVRVFDFVFNPDGTVHLREIGPGALLVGGVGKTPATAGKAPSQTGGKSGAGGSLKPIEGQ
ncbi:hypothetical protein [uncultured Roseobacter sp.]|uniref:hypothetical protein n=1 Tax=uncultured Roseobacter sp. TaxID=114847 RepID=UPI00262BD5D9|nr:hypothetical protein [uncultured Roseobacter sp.]